MKDLDQLVTRLYRRRISEAQYERFVKDDWVIERTHEKPRRRIQDLLDKGHCVTTGWMATSIRGSHTHWIIWKPRT